MGKYKIYYFKEYLPTRYMPNKEQTMDRYCVYDFKDGRCTKEIMEDFARQIIKIKGTNPNQAWMACFIPASSNNRTILRYKGLAQYIRNITNCACDVETISTRIDDTPGHTGTKKPNPADNFTIKADDIRGKNIILIDDVITRGRTFNGTADKLIACGALSVVGLILAKTINPDRNDNTEYTRIL